ncbi:YdcH family protein [Pseudomonas sp. GD03860]|uniref:YdcH family protein n=1 Tax=Pseudomonas TaxID=286 RepID=UPI002364643A|nr:MULTISPECIES: YdcH family protein [Pseudomonas]MDD2060962.1 YdcH family protein [Pseudomonas putida]MDH0635341.1 YdcH family protein [Pseudomonas sp. GD03860]
MPVKHDLLADLNMTKEAFDAKKKTDTRLSELHEKYNAIDTEVVKAESSSATDDQITQLRKKRLLIKDEIVAHVKS